MTSHDPITDRARDLFERASRDLDQGTAFRLRRARHEAQQPRRADTGGLRLLPAGAFAAALLALGLAWWLPSGSPVPADATLAAANEVETLLSEEDPEMYAWLADAPVATVATGPRL